MEKIIRDENWSFVIWGDGANGHEFRLTMTDEMLREMGFSAGRDHVNILDVRNVFRCNVTMIQTINHTVRYDAQ